MIPNNLGLCSYGDAQLWNQLLTLMMHENNQPFIVFLDLFEIRFHSWEASNDANRMRLHEWNSLRFLSRQPARGQLRLAWPDRGGSRLLPWPPWPGVALIRAWAQEEAANCLNQRSSQPLHFSPHRDQSAQSTLKGGGGGGGGLAGLTLTLPLLWFSHHLICDILFCNKSSQFVGWCSCPPPLRP